MSQKSKGFVVSGDITAEEIAFAISKSFPKLAIHIAGSSNGERNGDADPDVTISPFHNDESFNALLHELEEKDQHIKEAEEAASKAVESIGSLHKQQKDLFDEFVLLRQRYDEQKNMTVGILWNQCAKYHPDLKQIPTMEDTITFIENEDQVGKYIIGDPLGEGQYASVRSCTIGNIKNSKEYALKMIRKDRIMSFTALTRVSNEIENLSLLKSPYVVHVEQVIHTQNMLYIVTEKGGSDLFEFFETHPEGVQENWAREIIGNVLKGVLYCHDNGICHRDLKPENILVTFDTNAGKCVDLKLCDFGLSTKFKPKSVLTDFCGSPGFFCPEMVINGSYFGDKADVWSVGCILLELILGHERFCDIWMTAYDFELLQGDKELFNNTITETVEHLPDFLTFSEELNDFVMKFLELRGSRRPAIAAIGQHEWLQGALNEEIQKLKNYRPQQLAPSQSFIQTEQNEIISRRGTNVTKEVIQEAYNNISEKERRSVEEYNQHHHEGEEEHTIHLPPIMPETPNIKHAKKILRKGKELANKNYGHFHIQGNDDMSMESPDKQSNGSAFSSANPSPLKTPSGGPYSSPTHSLKAKSPLPMLMEQNNEEEESGNPSMNNSGSHKLISPKALTERNTEANKHIHFSDNAKTEPIILPPKESNGVNGTSGKPHLLASHSEGVIQTDHLQGDDEDNNITKERKSLE